MTQLQKIMSKKPGVGSIGRLLRPVVQINTWDNEIFKVIPDNKIKFLKKRRFDGGVRFLHLLTIEASQDAVEWLLL